MSIAKDSVVTVSYRLSRTDGEILEEADAQHPAAYLHGGYGSIFPKVEAALEGKVQGDEVDVLLAPEDAFGEYDAGLLRVEPLENFPPEVEVGMQLEGSDGREVLVYTVTDIAQGKVVVDANHPLAGKSLRVQCRVEGVRPATAEELEHGHAHGPDGHSHH